MDSTLLFFNVPPYEQTSFVARANFVEAHSDGGYTWQGKIQTFGKGDIVLTTSPVSPPTGFIRFTDRYYSIFGLDSTYSILVKHDLSAYDSDADDMIEGTTSNEPPENCDAAMVDILILETPEARAALNLLPASYLTNAFATINLILFNSDVPNRYVRCQRHVDPYDPISDCNGNQMFMNDFYANNPTLISFRDQYRVDGIILLTTCLDAPGYAVPGPNPQRPYAAVRLNNAMGPRFSLAHEFSHILGARHNRIHNGGDEPNNAITITHGWSFTDDDDATQWTIMALEPGQNSRILHLSNPDVAYNGSPTGTLTDQNYLRGLSQMCVMADFNPTFPAPLTVKILGDRTLCAENPEFPHVFSSFVTGPSPGTGMGPFSYEWRWSKEMFSPANQGTVIGGNNPELTLTSAPSCFDFYLKLKVTNTLFGVSNEAVIVVKPETCNGCPDPNIPNEERGAAPKLNILPNPTRDYATISVENPPKGTYYLEIISPDQTVVKRFRNPSNQDDLSPRQIDLSGLLPGIYAARAVFPGLTVTEFFTIIK